MFNMVLASLYFALLMSSTQFSQTLVTQKNIFRVCAENKKNKYINIYFQ